MIKRQKCVGQQQLMAAEEVLFGNLPSWQVPTRVGDETLLVVGPSTFLLLHKHAFICQLQPCEIILETCLRQFSPLNVIWHQYSFHNSKRFTLAVFFFPFHSWNSFHPEGWELGWSSHLICIQQLGRQRHTAKSNGTVRSLCQKTMAKSGPGLITIGTTRKSLISKQVK